MKFRGLLRLAAKIKECLTVAVKNEEDRQELPPKIGDYLAVKIEEDDPEERENDQKYMELLKATPPDGEDSSSSSDEVGTQELVDRLEKNMSMYISCDYSSVSIYKVPAKLRKVNPAAFTPRSVSIGPIHHGRPELEPMQRYKWRFFERYLGRSLFELDKLAKIARNMENRVRGCYQESFDKITSKEFSEMLMLDAVFVLVLLQEDKAKDDHHISASSQELNQWVRSDVIHDLMLLENQLPFFVLVEFNTYFEAFRLNLVKSILKFFSVKGYKETVGREIAGSKDKPRHLVDFLRTSYKPDQHHPRGKIVYNRSATELQEAGVRFKGEPDEYLFRIKFHRGKLTIPTLRIDEHTETLFRNMIAFEQCQYKEKTDITSYIIFMDSLINTAKDVDLLVGCKVIQNFHGDHETVARLFNALHKEILGHENEFYFTSLCMKLNDYSRDYWHQLKAKWFRSKQVLRRDYFNTPWSTISVVVALILLVLTVVQTICSIVPML